MATSEAKKYNTSKSSNGGPLSESKVAFKRLCRLHVASKAISWSFLYLINKNNYMVSRNYGAKQWKGRGVGETHMMHKHKYEGIKFQA